MISRSGRWPWRTTRCWPVAVFRSACFARNSATSASMAWPSSARAPLRRISVRESLKAPGWVSLITLLSDTAYHSFIGEVEALNTTTIRRLTRSRRHQLLAIAQLQTRGHTESYCLGLPSFDRYRQGRTACGQGVDRATSRRPQGMRAKLLLHRAGNCTQPRSAARIAARRTFLAERPVDVPLARRDCLPAGIALRYVRIIAGRVGAVIPILRRRVWLAVAVVSVIRRVVAPVIWITQSPS